MTSHLTNPRTPRGTVPIRPASAGERSDPTWTWAAYEPGPGRPWDLRLAGHLYRRAAFGANRSQLQQAVSDGPQKTVDRLLQPDADCEAFDRRYDRFEKDAAGSVDNLRAWWLRRMLETPHPLQERMTLLWHGHFATNGGGLNQPGLMREHVRLLRSNALGSFEVMLREVSRDPAVLLWLGAEANRKGRPNDAFVRPLLETFTLGPGQFDERDVREASRAFTGWFVLRDRLRYLPHEHDDGEMQVLGRRGRFTSDDLVRITLKHPATPRTLVRKLYRWFIDETEEPSETVIGPLAESFARDYSIGGVVETMLRSNLLFCQESYRARVKSPVEYAVGIVRALEGLVPTTSLGQDVAGLGQDLCRPPTVKGWPGGPYWIDTASLARRWNLAVALLQGGDPYGEKLDPWALARRHGYPTLEAAGRFLLELFLQGDIDSAAEGSLFRDLPSHAAGNRGRDEALRLLAGRIVTLPEYHLA